MTTGSVAQVNLVSNTPSIPAQITDPNLVNPWGIAGDANGNAWVADEGSGVATYEGPGGSTPEGTAVIIPPASGHGKGSPTGIVYNSTSAFSINGQPNSAPTAGETGRLSLTRSTPRNDPGKHRLVSNSSPEQTLFAQLPHPAPFEPSLAPSIMARESHSLARNPRVSDRRKLPHRARSPRETCAGAQGRSSSG